MGDPGTSQFPETEEIRRLLVFPALPFFPDDLRRRIGSVPLADWIMTWFVSETVVLTVIGILFRGHPDLRRLLVHV